MRAIAVFAIMMSAFYAVVGWWLPPPFWTEQADRALAHIPWIDEERYWSKDELELTGDSIHGAPVYRATLHTPYLTIDAIYPAMAGPLSVHFFRFADWNLDDRVWITRYAVTSEGDDLPVGSENEWIGRNNLDCNTAEYYTGFQLPYRVMEPSTPLFTLSQGQTDFSFPEGFGLPFDPKMTLSSTAQVLNHNQPEPGLKVRQRISIFFVRDKDLQQRFRPLYQRSLALMVPVGLNADVKLDSNITQCLPSGLLRSRPRINLKGQRITDHWVLPVGQEERRFKVTDALQLTQTADVHALGVHVHPYAEELTFRDHTMDTVLFKSKIQSGTEGIGLKEVQYKVDVVGSKVYPDHEYELVYRGNNVSGRSQDMMTVLLVYLYDSELDHLLKIRTGS
ncbi:MAG: hypothetical protein ACFB10_01915 [Salibacteraceae bacterium]